MADRRLADPFACADLVCREAALHGIGAGMDGIARLSAALWSDFHLDPLAFGRVTRGHFLGAVIAHPVAYGLSVAGNLQFARLADLVFNPLANLNDLGRLHSALGDRFIPGLRELAHALRRGDGAAVPLILLSGLSGLVATGEPAGPAVLFLWGVAVAFIVSYALIHMEMRHALPVVPLILIVTGWTVAPWWRQALQNQGLLFTTKNGKDTKMTVRP
jgi:hypothetical protein